MSEAMTRVDMPALVILWGVQMVLLGIGFSTMEEQHESLYEELAAEQTTFGSELDLRLKCHALYWEGQ